MKKMRENYGNLKREQITTLWSHPVSVDLPKAAPGPPVRGAGMTQHVTSPVSLGPQDLAGPVGPQRSNAMLTAML